MYEKAARWMQFEVIASLRRGLKINKLVIRSTCLEYRTFFYSALRVSLGCIRLEQRLQWNHKHLNNYLKNKHQIISVRAVLVNGVRFKMCIGFFMAANLWESVLAPAFSSRSSSNIQDTRTTLSEVLWTLQQYGLSIVTVAGHLILDAWFIFFLITKLAKNGQKPPKFSIFPLGKTCFWEVLVH